VVALEDTVKELTSTGVLGEMEQAEVRAQEEAEARAQEEEVKRTRGNVVSRCVERE